MTSLRTSIAIDLAGNLVRRARRYSHAIHRMSESGRRDFAALRRGSSLAGRAMGSVWGRLAVGAAVGTAARYTVGLERRMTRLGIAASASEAEIAALKDQIFATAAAPDISIDPSEIIRAVEAIVEKTGDLKFAENNLHNIGLTIQATGAGGQAVGELMAELQKLESFEGPRGVLEAIDTLNVQGKQGAFTLRNLAALGPRVITAYDSAVKGARDGSTMLKEMGAALQVIRMGTGSSEQAATAFERLLSELQNVDKLKQLSASGIQVFDPEQPGAEVMRPINELLLEIMEKSDGKYTVLGKIFGGEAVRSFKALNPDRMRRFMAAQGDGQTTMRDAARAAHDAAAALDRLALAWKRLSDRSLTTPLSSAADYVNYLAAGGYGRDAYDLIHNTDARTWGSITAQTMHALGLGGDLSGTPAAMRALRDPWAERERGGTSRLHVRIDAEGRPRVQFVEPAPGQEIDVDTGPVMVTP